MKPASELAAQLLAMAQHDTATGSVAELAEAITSEMRFEGVLRPGERVSRQALEDLVRGRRRVGGEPMLPSLMTGLAVAAYLEIIPAEAAADLLALLREPATGHDPRRRGVAGGRARQSAEVRERVARPAQADDERQVVLPGVWG